MDQGIELTNSETSTSTSLFQRAIIPHVPSRFDLTPPTDCFSSNFFISCIYRHLIPSIISHALSCVYPHCNRRGSSALGLEKSGLFLCQADERMLNHQDSNNRVIDRYVIEVDVHGGFTWGGVHCMD